MEGVVPRPGTVQARLGHDGSTRKPAMPSQPNLGESEGPHLSCLHVGQERSNCALQSLSGRSS